MKNALNDQRYTIGLECCGYAKPRYVARFCGDWIDCAATLAGAECLAIAHAEKRGFNYSVWSIVEASATGAVIMLKAGARRRRYRVAYGAHVVECRDIVSAAAEFETCRAHDAACG